MLCGQGILCLWDRNWLPPGLSEFKHACASATPEGMRRCMVRESGYGSERERFVTTGSERERFVTTGFLNSNAQEETASTPNCANAHADKNDQTSNSIPTQSS